jgi:hypothetical protein
MKFGMRMPSLKKRIAARVSVKRNIVHRFGIKAPRGFGFIRNPKKAAYNYVYNRTSFSIDKLFRVSKRASKSRNSGCVIVIGFMFFLIVMIGFIL